MTIETHALALRNGQSAPLSSLPRISFEQWRDQMVHGLSNGGRVSACFGFPDGEFVDWIAAIGRPASSDFLLLRTRIDESFPSMVSDCPQLQLFEREVAEQYGITPIGHPWCKPLRFHASWSGRDAFGRPPAAHPVVGDMLYHAVEGAEIHEVAVGPVHAGVIEPGHFRFQCHGEEVIFLEISLGYQHRNIERLLLSGPHPSTVHQIETIAGDTTIGHTVAFCRIIEGLSGTVVTKRAAKIRAVALELERLANHTGDIGALAGDVGFLPTAAYMGRIRGDYLNLQAELCGSRFGRGLVRPFGVQFQEDNGRLDRVWSRLKELERDTLGAMEVFFDSPSCLSRLERTGTVTRESAHRIGLAGMAARASGLDMDARRDFPVPGLEDWHPEIAAMEEGDVFCRAMIRRREAAASIRWLKQVLPEIENGDSCVSPADPEPDRICISAQEGWRGEIVHVAITDGAGRLARYKIVDPSFHNWSGLALSLRGQQISDFPLCNKSFNLSYCGFDL